MESYSGLDARKARADLVDYAPSTGNITWNWYNADGITPVCDVENTPAGNNAYIQSEDPEKDQRWWTRLSLNQTDTAYRVLGAVEKDTSSKQVTYDTTTWLVAEEYKEYVVDEVS